MRKTNGVKRDLMIARVTTMHKIKVKKRLAEHKKQHAKDTAEAARISLKHKKLYTEKMAARMGKYRCVPHCHCILSLFPSISHQLYHSVCHCFYYYSYYSVSTVAFISKPHNFSVYHFSAF